MARLSSWSLALALVLAPLPVGAVPTLPGELTNPLAEAQQCQNCHSFPNEMGDPSMPFYAPFFGWASTMMGNASRDPIFWAGVAIASQDHSGETIECVRCHSPRAFLEGRGDAIAQEELMPQDLVGVECEACHRMMDDGMTPAGNAQYTIDDVAVNGEVPRRGPWTYEPGDPAAPEHPWIDDPYTGTARMCGTCHDVSTPRERVDGDGNGLGTPFNEQRTYSEWLLSAFGSDPQDPQFRSCQDCHMPAETDVPGCQANVGMSSHATGGRRHDLVGANRFMVQVLQSLYGSAGTGDVPEPLWENTLAQMDAMLATAATLEATAPASVDLTAGLADLAVHVTNESGHKLPTGYSEGRVMWLEVVARYADEVVWSSGAWDQAMGTIEQDAQLRTYRAVAEEWATGTQLHLLLNDHWVEDTRIPPLGLPQNDETDPIGRYELVDGVWPNYDDVVYAFPAAPEVADATPAATDDDVLVVDVRLLYLVNTPEYVEFLAQTNRTNGSGDAVAMLFDDMGGAPPVVLAQQQLMIPITGFGASADGSSGTGSGTVDGGTGTTESSSSTGDGTGTTGQNDDGGGDCNCRTDTPRGAGLWLLGLALMVRRRRRVRATA